MARLRISLIIPTLNEESTIAATLDDLLARGAHEVIVVDGGSEDRTESLARPRATRFLRETGGLALQLNRGACSATGEVLLFHPADVRLPGTAFEEIERALARSGTVGGAFRLRLDSPRRAFRLIELLANLRNRLGFGPFGDQGIFTRRDVFERLGGFAAEASLEDLDLVRRLRRSGRFVILPTPIRASARRWEKDGLLATTAAHYWAGLIYLLGARGKVRALKNRFQRRR